MELTWLMRIRIAAAMGAGMLLIGLAAWPLVAPAVPGGAITIQAGDISVLDVVIVAALAFAAGFLAYFAAWPYGSDIAVLAAPAGLALWAVRSGSMSDLLRMNMGLSAEETIAMRQDLFFIMRWEGLLWLAVAAAGYAGVRLAAGIIPAGKPVNDAEIGNTNTRNPLNIMTALIASVVIGSFAMGIFAQDVRMFDSELGSVIGQPGKAQIGFAVVVSFGIAAFVAKRLLDVSWIVPALASGAVAFYGIWLSAKRDVLEHMVESWPEAFFARSVCAVLPIQFAAFGAIGAVIGYWSAIKYAHWRKHGE
ncbi:MAG TPA: hypothetical protein P5279_15850 [Anaerohalosphaeraceae bacterium]|nr:hypothetical protein [Anaerohalosphaeraceae bacterium]HRT51963.1 hypothetical protein [Anaerohalosphaeraceae bacterium]HRT88019.1 hypothetical protein [Anaerohalosphaeraceae bacterium]